MECEVRPSTLMILGLRAGYNSRVVLQDIDLMIDMREMLHLTGRNGAGKSTLLKSIAGVLSSVATCIAFDGVNLNTLTAETRRELGIIYIPQGGRVFTRLSVLD